MTSGICPYPGCTLTWKLGGKCGEHYWQEKAIDAVTRHEADLLRIETLETERDVARARDEASKEILAKERARLAEEVRTANARADAAEALLAKATRIEFTTEVWIARDDAADTRWRVYAWDRSRGRVEKQRRHIAATEESVSGFWFAFDDACARARDLAAEEAG